VGNRLRLHEDLAQLDSRVARYGYTYSVAMCDLDHFKAYNDALGHPAGDAALRSLAAILSRHCRESDAVYRYGGEEFAIIMPEQSLMSAAVAMERIRVAVERAAISHPASPTAPILTISVGVAERHPDDDGSTAMALNRADAALYEAKLAGRNKVHMDGAAPPVLA
jgi:two-component system chemotaxis response regulator CheY